MKSLVVAAVVLILEAGFIAGVAVLPTPPEAPEAGAAVASRPAPPPPSARPPSRS